MTLVVLRPEPGASASVARAAALGLEAVARPLFRVEPLAWIVPQAQGFDGLLLTSANAIRYGGPGLAQLSALPVYAVGEATAAAARDSGFSVVQTGAGGVDALLSSLPPALRLLHLAGEDRTGTAHSQSISAVSVYRSTAIEPPPLLSALAPAVLLVHSPRAGRRVEEIVADKSGFTVAAISAAAAASCGSGWRAIASAGTPDDAALLSLAARLCQSSLPK